jgi:hypothetical protein
VREFERIPRRLSQPRPVFPQDWDLSLARRPSVLSTEYPFTIRYAASVWEQLHPIGELLRPHRIHYLPNPRSNVRKR